MSKLSCLAGAALAALLCAATLGAQEVRGVVRDGSTAQPIVGAVLLLLDSAGVSRARNLTDARGAYRIATSAWMKRMRVVRIGFRPTEVEMPPLRLASDVAQLDVTMVALPTLLEPVQVNSHAMCSARKDRVVALSLLEQARAGLLSAIVAQEKMPAEMIRLRAAESFDDNGAPTHLRVRVDSSTGVGHAFQAVRSAADFVKLGFYDDHAETLYAPDAETLLDDDFRDGYCFLLRDRDAKRPTAVGLGFAPAKSKNGRIDVDGTLWIDTLSRRLLQIDYAYLGLSRLMERAQPAGVVQFRTLDNGIVIIDGWNIRLPSVEVDSSERSPTGFGRLKRTVVRPQTTGGVVANAHWPDGFTWTAPLATARIALVDRDGQPVKGRTMRLDETDYRGVSDSAGAVVIRRLLPGPYAASLEDTTLDPIGVALHTSLKFAVADTQTFVGRVVAPSAADYVAELCRTTNHDEPDLSAAWFVTRVVDAGGKPLDHAEWHGWRYRPSREGKDSAATTWLELPNAGHITSSDGLLAYCGSALSVHDVVRLEIRPDRKTPWQLGQLTLTDSITVARLRLSKP